MTKPTTDQQIWRIIAEYDKFLPFDQRAELSMRINEILKDVMDDRLMELERNVNQNLKVMATMADTLKNHNNRLIAVSEKVEAIDEAMIDQLQNMPDVEGLEDRVEHAETMGAMFDDRIITLEIAGLRVNERLRELEEISEIELKTRQSMINVDSQVLHRLNRLERDVTNLKNNLNEN
jgi:Zn-dependent metalloprotease